MRLYITNLLKINYLISANNLNIRFYPRWTHRRPVKVLTQEQFDLQEESFKKQEDPRNISNNVIQLDPTQVQQNLYEPNLQKKVKKQTRRSIDVKEKLFDLEKLDSETHFQEREERKPKKPEKKTVKYTDKPVEITTLDEDGNFVYTKMKDNDAKIGTLMLMVKSKKLRKNRESILLEGKRLIRDALECRCTLQHLLFSRKNDLEFIRDLLPKKGVNLYKMAYRDMQMWSDLTTCPGIMGIFKRPEIENILAPKKCIPLTIICDNIREPGNLGTILRSCVAAGCEKILLTKGCVELWDTKVLRSSAGAHFRIPIQTNLEWNKIKELLPSNDAVFLADNNIVTAQNNATNDLQNLCLNVPLAPYYGVNFCNYNSVVVIIGGETLGLSENAYKFATENNGVRLNIPLENKVESLNTGTALSIIVFELKRQLLLLK